MNSFADEACSHASSKILAFGDIVWHFQKFLLRRTLKSAICGQTCRQREQEGGWTWNTATSEGWGRRKREERFDSAQPESLVSETRSISGRGDVVTSPRHPCTRLDYCKNNSKLDQIAWNPLSWDNDWPNFGPSNPLFLDKKWLELLECAHSATCFSLMDYCCNSINSSVTRHRGSEIDEILMGHRSQGPATKSPGQSKNWVLFPLKIDFFSSWRLSSNLRASSDSQYFKLFTYRHRHFDENFWQSHHARWCDESNISSRRSQVTRCDELIELAQYSGVNPAEYLVSTGGLRGAELELEKLSLSLVLSLHLLQATRSNSSTNFFILWAHR